MKLESKVFFVDSVCFCTVSLFQKNGDVLLYAASKITIMIIIITNNVFLLLLRLVLFFLLRLVLTSDYSIDHNHVRLN